VDILKASALSMVSDLEKVVASIASSKKYGAVCDDTVRRIAERELAHRGSLKAATKATKRRLHQIYGGFEQPFDYDLAYQQLAAAYLAGSEADIKAASRNILGQHSSTRERLPILDQFYAAILAITGRPESILDLGCGLNPLALPWMGLACDARYIALDIDAERIRFLNRFLPLAGLSPLARCQDVLNQPPRDEADLALLLKMSPSLERQEPGSTLWLLEQLTAPCLVVSYAAKSLGGREKGMPDQYEQQFSQLAQNRDWSVEKLVFETELVFVVQRGPAGKEPGTLAANTKDPGG
jgi:16S rRNA (guanine(1405)-N(7))-methyltransferase